MSPDQIKETGGVLRVIWAARTRLQGIDAKKGNNYLTPPLFNASQRSRCLNLAGTTDVLGHTTSLLYDCSAPFPGTSWEIPASDLLSRDPRAPLQAQTHLDCEPGGSSSTIWEVLGVAIIS